MVCHNPVKAVMHLYIIQRVFKRLLHESFPLMSVVERETEIARLENPKDKIGEINAADDVIFTF